MNFRSMRALQQSINGFLISRWTKRGIFWSRGILYLIWVELWGDGFPQQGMVTKVSAVTAATSADQSMPSVAMNASGEFAIVWRRVVPGGADIYAQRYQPDRHPMAGVLRLNSETAGVETMPDVSIDADGHFMAVWSNTSSRFSDYIFVRWFDPSGNLLTDETQIRYQGDIVGRNLAVDGTPDGEFVVVWADPNPGGIHTGVLSKYFTVKPPEILSVEIGADRKSLVVGFSQEMATYGVGNALDPANWGLKLPDGRYLIQVNPQLSGLYRMPRRNNLDGESPRTITREMGRMT